ncbi:MAG: DUF1294 domain-containing protein [Lentisphaeria bacterium]|nr:DUF1294 domain-containing protein [Lentisphaeria bacterium]
MLKFLFSLIPLIWAGVRFPGLLLPLGIYAAVISLFTFCAYGSDKFFAVMHWRRIPEDFLIILGFAGGVPGAFAGMKLFRHKTAKPYFDRALTTAVIMQIIIVCAADFLFR